MYKFSVFLPFFFLLSLVEEANLNNHSTHILQILHEDLVSGNVQWDIMLTPLVLVLPMFFTTLHTLSQQPYNII